MREGHPVLWSLDDPRPDGCSSIEYPYFERAEPIVWDEPGTYVETDVEFAQNVTHEWNHGLGEIVTALLDAGMELTGARRARQRAVGRAARADGGRRRWRVAPERPARAAAPHLHAAGRQARLSRAPAPVGFAGRSA